MLGNSLELAVLGRSVGTASAWYIFAAAAFCTCCTRAAQRERHEYEEIGA